MDHKQPKYAMTTLTPSKWDIVRQRLTEDGETSTVLFRIATECANSRCYHASMLLMRDERDQVYDILQYRRYDSPISRCADTTAAISAAPERRALAEDGGEGE